MPTGLLTDKGMIGSGDLMVQDLSDCDAQWRPIGNARVFTLQPLVEKYERKSYQRATAGQTLETINRTNGVDVRITVDTFGRKNLAIALGGSDAALTQSEVTAGSATLTLPMTSGSAWARTSCPACWSTTVRKTVPRIRIFWSRKRRAWSWPCPRGPSRTAQAVP